MASPLEQSPFEEFGDLAERKSDSLGEALDAYREARVLVDAGLATMQADEAGDSVEIRDAKGSIVIATDKYAILEKRYRAYKDKREKELLAEEPGEISH